MNNKISTGLGIAILILLGIIINPGDVLMPTNFQMTLAIILLVLVAIFCLFVWKEKPLDEREELHMYKASRYSFLAGAGVIVIGMVWQSKVYTGDFCQMYGIDPWLAAALAAMMIAKLFGRHWVQEKN